VKLNSECWEVDGHRAIATGRLSLTDKGDFPGNTVFSNAFWRIAALAAAGIVCAASPTQAAPSVFWPDYYEPYPAPRVAPSRVRKSIKKRMPTNEDVAKDARKPQGPLIIAISIEKQVLRIYDANGYFAETPISTGMRGHSTPMGVFSVIQKHKYHHSNIYSGAPMPYMQRITWSGVAMHAGVLPGYPASHGCIRMPMNFAVKMWGWTRMGARVVITPGELTPESFSHPLLAMQKISPAAAAQTNVDVAVTAKSDKAALVASAVAPPYSEASLELKSTVGHDLARPAAGTHTADASSALSQPRSPVTIIDAPVTSNPAMKTDDDTAGAVDKAGDAPETGIQAAETAAAESSASADQIAKSELPAGDSAKAEDLKPEAAKAEPADVATVKTETVNADALKPIDKSEQQTPEQVKAAGDAASATPDVNKDQTRPSDPEKAAVPKPEPALATAPKRGGQIAVFVSKKDGKLYVRQNFAPLFDAPVTIAASDRPLGTHVFTAQTDKDDGNLLHWSVVSMPVVTRYAARQDDDERASRRRKTTGAIEVKPAPHPDSAAEALDRLTIPADAMARINEALSTGGSIIVSDQGINGGETGEGTDFIIPLR
jgi:lipoprotein-anchoring transpeptidase ErfK/SrfK